MASYEIQYAQDHLPELFHDARLGQEVIIVREDGSCCELTPLAQVRNEEADAVSMTTVLTGTEETPGDLVPA